MNSTHFHLLLNHFPIIGTLIGSGLLLWGIIKKKDNLKSIAAVVLTLMAIIAIPVYLTGEPAEESVEKLPGVSDAMIELHEDAANIAIWLMGVTGLASLTALLLSWQKRKMASTLFLVAFVISLASFISMARTGYLGGQIRHSEIRNGNSANGQAEKVQAEKSKEKDDD